MRFARESRTGSFVAILLFSFLLCLAAFSEDSAVKRRLTNQDVIAMVSAGISQDVILAKIRTASAAGSTATNFDTSVEGLKTLKAANVPDAIVKAMIDPTPAVTPTVVNLAGPTTLSPNLPPPEVGVYWRDGSNFVLIPGQAISQSKVGGKAANVFTYGIRQQHWDAFVNGKTSNNRVRELRPTFYFYVPDGASSADYVLLKLTRKGDRREFQIGKFGGWFGGSSGVERDKELSFEADHVGIRIYKVSLSSDLKPGEYAFFMGTGQQSATEAGMAGKGAGGAATGRIFDFTIPE